MKLTLTEKHTLTEDVRAYTFSTETEFSFIAGQFVMLKQMGAENKFARAFSMASGPNKTTATFVMKHIPDGHVSGFLANAEIGTQLEAGKPTGRFILQDADTDRVFVATGTGLAPMISFLETPPDGIPLQIVFGVRGESDLFWTDKLPSDTLITLSQPTTAWTGAIGRVTAHIPKVAEHHPHAAWYLCGSPDMVKDVRTILISLGVPTDRIHFEIY